MRSLLDAVDLRAVRAAAASLDGPFATVVACLGAGAVLAHDPADPAWPDRDRLFVGDAGAMAAIRQAWPETGAPGETFDGSPGSALGAALGAGIGSALDGGIFRVWCLVGTDAVRDGVLWEAARTAAAEGCGLVTAVVCGEAGEAAALFTAAGWAVEPAESTDPVAVLVAMDHALARTGRPTAIVLPGPGAA